MSILPNNRESSLLVHGLTIENIQRSAIDICESSHRGLYFLLQDDEIVYVGKSDSLIMSRIADHIKMKDSLKVFNRYFAFPMPDASPAELSEIESQSIAKFCPKYNRHIRSCKTHALKSELESQYGMSIYLTKRLVWEGLLTPIEVKRSTVFLREEIEGAIEWCKSNKDVGTESERRHCRELLERQSSHGCVKRGFTP